MVFSSSTFLFLFLPIVLTIYLAIGNNKVMAKNSFLLFASLFFYTWGEASYVAVMIASIIINYIVGIKIDSNTEYKRKKWLIAGITLNLVILGHFKYTNFLVDNINELLVVFGIESLIYMKKPVHLPIGISFFTFQAISYLVDVYRKTAQVRKNPINLALYISLFPQLIAGPIIRYNSIAEQIRDHKTTVNGLSYGIQRFIIGLGKKVIIANNLGYVVDQIFTFNATDISSPLLWIAMILYGLQIFYDFSGYSDMAIGLGRMFGFKFLENFNYPYISRSLREFWRRWHISLSSWFRDYLYIPLGGNKKGVKRMYFNLALVFFLCGLWHGASWNFIIWGLFHGSFLILERLKIVQKLTNNLRVNLGNLIFTISSHCYLLLIITVSWVFFRSGTIEESTQIIKSMFFGNDDYLIGISYLLEHGVLLFVLPIAILLSMPFNNFIKSRFSFSNQTGRISMFALLLLTLLLSIIFIGSNSYNPFIYFQF